MLIARVDLKKTTRLPGRLASFSQYYSKNRRETEIGKLGWNGYFDTGIEINMFPISVREFLKYFLNNIINYQKRLSF